MILILGVTASGKSTLAFDLANDLGGEIISIDSMKVYRKMDIGTAKASEQRQAQVKYHLIDAAEPWESFGVGRFLESANKTIDELRQRNIPIIAAGGTALYIKTLLYGLFEGPGSDEAIREELKRQSQIQGLKTLYEKLQTVDPAAAERIHPNDEKRIIRALEVYEITAKPISSFQNQFEAEKTIHPWTIVGLRRDKQTESGRINQRVKKMIEAGLVDEVKLLLSEEKPLSKQAHCAIGYAEIIDYLNGKQTLEDAVELIKKNTRTLAKHQRTWFRSFRNVHWLDVKDSDSAGQILVRTKELLSDIEHRA